MSSNFLELNKSIVISWLDAGAHKESFSISRSRVIGNGKKLDDDCGIRWSGTATGLP